MALTLNRAGLRFLGRSILGTAGFFGVILLLGLKNNYQYAMGLAWWEMPLGPGAWFVDKSSHFENDKSWQWVAGIIVCVAFSVSPLIAYNRATRICCVVGVILWWLAGFSVVNVGA